VVVVTILLSVLVIGYAITRLHSLGSARLSAWLMVVVGVVGVERLTSDQPAGFRMLAIIGVLLYCMKSVVSVEACAADKSKMSTWNWCRFAALWFGMRPELFSRPSNSRRSGGGALCWLGVKRLIAGALLVVAARAIWIAPLESVPETTRRIAASIILLPGLSLVVHFGFFNILAGLWRIRGVNCRALFRAPLLSKSLAEFWGRRWNLAFSEMTALGVFRPLRGYVGTRMATNVAFLFSGLLHELAISVPVNAGYGRPALYFALQSIAMSVERRRERMAVPISGVPWRGKLWTISWLLIPLPLLFHEPFLNGCVWPLIGMEIPTAE